MLWMRGLSGTGIVQSWYLEYEERLPGGADPRDAAERRKLPVPRIQHLP
jgi:hypothetical protein